MSVMDMNSRMAMAEKLSVQQLQQAVQSGSLPAYIGIPLIEQKTKEKAQMAAAQGGQQKPPSVAASILQQADQQEQQERGIDELPSNLPMMEDEEMGMAGGGIIAFAAGTPEGVKDPEQDPRIVALRKDPAYLAFAESGGIEGDTSLTAFLQAGNDTSTPVRYPLTDRERENIRNKMELQRGQLQSAAQQARDAYSPNNASINNRAPGVPMGEVFGTYADKAQRVLQGNESNVPSDLRAYSDRGMFSNMPTGGPDSRPPAAPDDNESDVSNMAPQLVAPDMERRNFPPQGNAGITAAPGAKLAPEGTPGAPRTAPQGGVSPSISRQISSVNPGAPASLSAAEDEASKSPRAAAALSMLDKYVAQLEKSGESVGRDKKEALYMALIQGGLAAAGGMSPNALQNIAQGAMVGAQNYQQALASIKKDDRARLEKLISAGLKKEEFLLKAEEIGVKRDTARMVYDASMARTGAMGGGKDGRLSFLEQKQLEGMQLKYLQEATKATNLMNKELGGNIAYTSLITKINNPKTTEAERKKLQASADAMKQPYLSTINDAKEMASLYGGKLNRPSESSAGNMPKGIPQGSKQVGTSGGKPVYESPDGKRYIVE